MSTIINNITLCGNITKDPELRFTPGGSAVATFSIAVNNRVKDRVTSEWLDEVNFFTVVTWFRLAENCAKSLKRGDRVVVTGRLSQRNWTDKSGTQKSFIEVVASNVGASLEFATCEIWKNPKAEPGQARETLTEADVPF